MNIAKTRLKVSGIICILILTSLNFSGSEPKVKANLEHPIVSKEAFSIGIRSIIQEPTPIIEIPAWDQSTIFTPEEIKNILELAGFEGKALRTAFGIVLKESTGRPYAHNQNSSTGDNSYGLFQINMIGSLGPARRSEFGLSNNEELFSPLKNAEIAYIISDGGSDWGPWGGVSRKVLNFMNEFPE